MLVSRRGSTLQSRAPSALAQTVDIYPTKPEFFFFQYLVGRLANSSSVRS